MPKPIHHLHASSVVLFNTKRFAPVRTRAERQASNMVVNVEDFAAHRRCVHFGVRDGGIQVGLHLQLQLCERLHFSIDIVIHHRDDVDGDFDGPDD